MRLLTPQVTWHAGDRGVNEPIMSADFHPSGMLATAGADTEIRLWTWDLAGGAEAPEFVAALQGHTKGVNAVRWAPDGSWLASASDDGNVRLWKRPDDAPAGWSWRADVSGQADVTKVILRGHNSDVYDLEVAPDGKRIITASIDNSAIVWDVEKTTRLFVLNDHSNYVQGVAWDPANMLVATESSDRSVRVYGLPGTPGVGRNRKTPKCVHVLKQREFAPSGSGSGTTTAGPADDEVAEIVPAGQDEARPAPPPAGRHRLFCDETVQSFVRRLQWSPDGNILLVPAAQYQAAADAPIVPTVYAFARGRPQQPLLHFPCGDKPAVAVRFSPRLWRLREGAPRGATDLPYRLVFAVATLSTVLVYDTQHLAPLLVVRDAHYAGLTDVAWSHDGLSLVATSSDGYCTAVRLEDGELGELLPPTQACEVYVVPPRAPAKKKKSAAASPAAPAPAPASAAPSAASPAPTVKPPPGTPAAAAALDAIASLSPATVDAAVAEAAALRAPTAADDEPMPDAPQEAEPEPEPEPRPAKKRVPLTTLSTTAPPQPPAAAADEPAAPAPAAAGSGSDSGGEVRRAKKRVAPTLLAAAPAESPAQSPAPAPAPADGEKKRVTPTRVEQPPAAAEDESPPKRKRIAPLLITPIRAPPS